MSKALMILAVAAAALAGCKNEERGSGLPPAQEWNTPTDPGASGGAGATAGMDNPHGGNPHGGMMDDPHAGLDMGATNIAEASGMEAPDPDRAIDPNNVLKGTIKVSPALAQLIKPEHAIFLSVKPYDPATKGPARMPPMAVAKLENARVPIAFELSEHDAMVKGTRMVGDVVITAHVSTTHDATTKKTGEVIGMVRATVPAEKLELVLDAQIP